MAKSKRPLDTVKHRRVRESYFAAHPVCERCEKKGKVKPSYILHHKDRNQENWSCENLEALCNECHEIEHGRKIVSGCDVNGFPINEDHPWKKMYKQEQECISCRKKFISTNVNRKYCSGRCKSKTKYIEYEKQHGIKIWMVYKKKINPYKETKKKCEICGIDFIVKSGAGAGSGASQKQKYCSKECCIKSMRILRHEKTCVVCGKKFKTYKERNKCCSKQCGKILALGELIEKECPQCGNVRKVFSQNKLGDVPKNLLCERCTSNNRKRKKDKFDSMNITNDYVRDLLRRQKKIINNDTIELKRQQIIAVRILKELKQRRKEREDESNYTDVYGKQQPNEKNYEGQLQDGRNRSLPERI